MCLVSDNDLVVALTLEIRSVGLCDTISMPNKEREEKWTTKLQ